MLPGKGRAAWVLVLLLGAASCGGGGAKPAVELDTDETIVVSEAQPGSGVIATYTEPVDYEQGIGLHARFSGDSLVISFRNKSGGAVDFLPRDFAIITGTRRGDLLVLTPEAATFATSDLTVDDGDKALADVRLVSPRALTGLRLVYNNPRQNIRFFTVIQ